MYWNVKGKQIFALSKQVSKVYLKSAFYRHIVTKQSKNNNKKNDDKNTILFYHLFFCK